MDFGKECPKLLLRFRDDAETMSLGEFMARAGEFMAAFVPLHSDFQGLRLLGRNATNSPPLQPDLANLRPWLMTRAWAWRHRPSVPYTDLDPSGKPSLQSTRGNGFRLYVGNLRKPDEEVYLKFWAGSMGGYVSITLPRKDRPEFQQAGFGRELLALGIRHWPVSHASFGLSEWITLLRRGPGLNFDLSKGPIEVGWLSYLADSRLAEDLPPPFRAEAFGSGVVWISTPDPKASARKGGGRSSARRLSAR